MIFSLDRLYRQSGKQATVKKYFKKKLTESSELSGLLPRGEQEQGKKRKERQQEQGEKERRDNSER